MEKLWEALLFPPEGKSCHFYFRFTGTEKSDQTKELQLLRTSRQRKNRRINATALWRRNNGELPTIVQLSGFDFTGESAGGQHYIDQLPLVVIVCFFFWMGFG